MVNSARSPHLYSAFVLSVLALSDIFFSPPGDWALLNEACARNTMPASTARANDFPKYRRNMKLPPKFECMAFSDPHPV